MVVVGVCISVRTMYYLFLLICTGDVGWRYNIILRPAISLILPPPPDTQRATRVLACGVSSSAPTHGAGGGRSRHTPPSPSPRCQTQAYAQAQELLLGEMRGQLALHRSVSIPSQPSLLRWHLCRSVTIPPSRVTLTVLSKRLLRCRRLCRWLTVVLTQPLLLPRDRLCR